MSAMHFKEFSSEQKPAIFNSFEKVELTPKNLREFDKPITEDFLYSTGEEYYENSEKNEVEGSGVTQLPPGEKGSWNEELNEPSLKPDHTYEIGEYSYQTDSEGRLSKVTGELELETSDRNGYQQVKSAEAGGIKDGRAEDDGGHMIASIFNGPGEQINLLPMDSNLNRGEWKRMENLWAKALGEEPPKKVSVEIQPVYEDGSKRPTSFDVYYTIDGEEHFSSFENSART